VRNVAPCSVRRSRQAVSAAFRYSLPHRGPGTVAPDHASHNLARPLRAHTGGSTPVARTDSTLPDFHPLQRVQNRGFGPRGLSLPATFRPQRFSRSRRLAPRDSFRACFIPVTLLGFEPSGPCSSPGGRTSLEADCSLAVRARLDAAKRRAGPRSSEPCSPRRVRAATGRNRAAVVALLALPL
jgi:hypothetical protein